MGESAAVSDRAARGIQLQQLTKAYGRLKALNRVDLSVQEGSFLTIVGPNGAGKTTLLGVIAGLIRPTRGRVWLNGVDLTEERDPVVGRTIGLLSFQTYLYEDLTVEENLRFYGRLYDVEPLDRTIEGLLEQAGMTERRHSRVATLSRGMRQRIGLARAILHDPPVLLLDEPYAGLDQEAIAALQTFLSEKTRTVLLATHDLDRGLEVADHVAIMVRGRLAYHTASDGMTAADFHALYRQYTG